MVVDADAASVSGLKQLRSRSDRGSVAVEAAIVFPLLILILFGVIEFALVLRDHVAMTSAARSGARVASAQPRLSTFAIDSAAAVARAGTTMPLSTIGEVWVYESNSAGYPTNGGSITATTEAFTACTTKCLVFTPSGSSLVQSAGAWSHEDVNACPGDEAMTSLGVLVRGQHSFVTGLFGVSMDLSDHAVLRFEPIPASQLLQSGQCKP